MSKRALALIVLLAASLSSAVDQARGNRPDIAILLTDQQRADTIGVAGTPGVTTPTLDRLAREGVRFTHAFCPTPQCSPARAALLTGRFPHRTGVMGNVAGSEDVPAGQSPPLDPAIPSLGRRFANAGYEAAYFGKWHLGGTAADHGFDVDNADRTPDKTLADQVVTFLDRKQPNDKRRTPRLIVVSWINPHDIYHIRRDEQRDFPIHPQVSAPESLVDDLADKPLPQRHYLAEDQGKPLREYTVTDWRRYKSFYHHLTEQVDEQIGKVVEALRRNNAQTLIVFSSDHGDLGGAHGLPFKGPAMYDELIRVPLTITWPGHIKPAVRNELVSLIDILPTLCDLADIDRPDGIDGRSLRPLITQGASSDPSWREAVYGEYYGKQNWRVPIRMVRTGRWKYVRYLDDGEELYDLQFDPHELHNLAGHERFVHRKQKLVTQLDRWIQRTGDPFATLTTTDRNGHVRSGP
jgi:arylsulfatase A-like enzyme